MSRTAFYDDSGELQHSASEIREEYLGGWFLADFISCLPANYVAYMPNVNLEGHGKSVKMLKMFRLLKLLRIARLQRMFHRYEQKLHGILHHLKIAKLVIIVLVIGHLMGCYWFMCGLAGGIGNNADGTRRIGWVEKRLGPNVRSDWITECKPRAHRSGLNWFALRADGMAFYFAIMTMTTVGYGDIHPEKEVEIWFAVRTCTLPSSPSGHVLRDLQAHI